MRNLILLLLFLPTTICYAQSPEASNAGWKRDTLRLPLHLARGAEVEDVFSKVDYIELEYTKNSVIQEVKDLWVTEKYFIVFDQTGASILFFTKNGKYSHKIDKVPNCKDCLQLGYLFKSVFVDKANELVYATYGTTLENSTLGIFDFQGRFVAEKKDLFDVDGMGFLKESFYLNRFFFDSTKPQKLEQVKEGIQTGLMKHNLPLKDYRSFGTISKNVTDGYLFYTELYQSNYYKLADNGIIGETLLIFPAQYTLPVDFVKRYSGALFETLSDKYPLAIFAINNIIQIKNYNYYNFWAINGSDIPSAVLYSRNSGELYDLAKLRPSAFNDYLPVLSYLSTMFYDSDDSHFYSTINRDDLNKTLDRNPLFKDRSKIPLRFKTFLEKPVSKTNPILVVCALR